MMTLRRFTALAAAYGADLRRWPDAVRGRAEALLASSPEARAALEEARTLDRQIAAARKPLPEGQDAALARLRAGVAARIAAPPPRPPVALWTGRASAARDALRSWQPRWTGVLAGGGIAIIAGLAIGALYPAEPEGEGLMTVLQPAPIQMFAD
jgi:hypothetical protein